jgi:hypothetical protein
MVLLGASCMQWDKHSYWMVCLADACAHSYRGSACISTCCCMHLHVSILPTRSCIIYVFNR